MRYGAVPLPPTLQHVGIASGMDTEYLIRYFIVDFTDADITVKSSDGIIFRLHRKNLEVATGAFQLADSQTNSDEIVVLSEPAAVLMILFQFIYPQKHPRLEEGAFESLLAVAEAVEKYKIFSAMYVSETRLMQVLTFFHPFNMALIANYIQGGYSATSSWDVGSRITTQLLQNGQWKCIICLPSTIDGGSR